MGIADGTMADEAAPRGILAVANNLEQLQDGFSALDQQVGGGHYKDLKIQPVEYIHANNLGFIEGCIVKYITRFRNKNGKQDLLKIKHFVDLLIQLEYPD